MALPSEPSILTTVVGSYPVPDWLAALGSEQALRDATGVVLLTQDLAGIDLVADGELYRFDVNHPDTNGMIDFFVRPLGGVRTAVGRSDADLFARQMGMGFRRRLAAVVEGELTEGTLDLVEACRRARRMTRRPFKFTVTGPHMLARTLLDRHYGDPGALAMALAGVLAAQVAELDAEVVQVDEANITGHPEDAVWAVPAINRVLRAIPSVRGMHLCFGNYGGQTIQKGEWRRLTGFLNQLEVDHVLVEMARRSAEELDAWNELDPRIRLGLGVVDIKSTVVEEPGEIARRIEEAVRRLGLDRIRFVNPDCGFWMLKRSVADRKLRALVEGRDLFLGK